MMSPQKVELVEEVESGTFTAEAPEVSQRGSSFLYLSRWLTPQVPCYDARETKRILRKVDVRLLPVLALLYVIAFLDRGNIGNAKVAGMNADLKLTGAQYNLCLTVGRAMRLDKDNFDSSQVFFLPYATFEVPSNIMLKLLRPSRWITVLVLSWGTVSWSFPTSR